MIGREIIGLLGIILLIVLMGIGIPVGFSLCIAGFLGTVAIFGLAPGMSVIGNLPYHTLSSYVFMVLPMFILMGEFTGIAGIANDLYKSGNKWMGRIPGGMGLSTTLGCALFGAVSGSTVGATSLFGRIAFPEMKELGYSDEFSSGCIAASGSMAALIPPSGVMVIYSILTTASLGKLMIAGFIPGFLSSLIYIGMMVFWVYLRPHHVPKPQKNVVPWKEKIISLIWTAPVFLVVFVMIGGIYTGKFTPTEAGAIGAFCTFVMALIKKSLDRRGLMKVIMNTGQICTMVLMILVGAEIFGRFITASDLAKAFSEYIIKSGLPQLGTVCLILLLYLVLGTFMSAVASLAITIPFLLEAITASGVDLVWFGILCIKMVEIAAITPPLGANVYALKGVIGDRIRVETIFKGSLPFLAMDFLTLGILITFPGITLWLPNMML